MVDDTARIPLMSRWGEVNAWTLVDETDCEWLNQWTWRFGRKGYAHRMERGRCVLMHREILGLEYGDGLEGDHVDRDKLNNRRSNLRILQPGQNAQNIPLRTSRTSKYRNVHWSKDVKKWRVTVWKNGRTVGLGHFTDEDEAGAVARAWREEHMPFAVD